ncbi:MAG: TPM domain-containing protein, partial [Syntrophales bacterium]
MKNYSRVLFFLLIVLFLLPGRIGGQEKFPRPTGAINDFAGIIPAEYESRMNSIAEETLRKTGASIVVATFPTAGDISADEFANRLYADWGVGKKGEDKGVLIFLALKERKIRIETGYGVEGILPDGLVGEILDRHTIPFLRKGEYGRGLLGTVKAVSEVIAADAGVSIGDGPSAARERMKRIPGRLGLWEWVLIGIVLAFLIGTKPGRYLLLWMIISSSRGSGGGGFGG